jgi:BirA family biotin operon repressor/biotin-[acetyl-CoA-carboxylase] ligase
VIARRQRFGRGQQGRPWFSPNGGVWLSAALPWPAAAELAAAPGLAVAVGLCLRLEARGLPVRLKWPNDLVLQTAAGPRKLAGLLPGLRLRSGRVRWARIGVGLNGRNRVPAGATGLRSFRGVWSGEPLAVTALVLAGLERAMALAIDREGVRLRAETLLEPGGPLWLEGEWGQPRGLAPDGGLLLAHPDGRERNLRRHGYSNLLDLERLLDLIQLLATYPDLEGRDPGSREALEALVSPRPEGPLAERAALYLRRLHGACYGDAEAIRADLLWLEGVERLSPMKPAMRGRGGLAAASPTSLLWAAGPGAAAMLDRKSVV